MSRKDISKTLKRLRQNSKLTAAQVGEIVGKSGKTISAWENNHGQPDAEMLMQLCKIYNVEDILSEFRADIVGEEETEKSPLTLKGRELSERDLLMLSLFQQIPEDKQSAFLDAFEILLRTSGVIE